MRPLQLLNLTQLWLLMLMVVLIGFARSFSIVKHMSCGEKLSKINARSIHPVHTRTSFSVTCLNMAPLSPRPRPGTRPQTPSAPPPPINENIRADPVRLIAPVAGGNVGEEEMLGIYPLEEALEKAAVMELDLVMINEKGDPPVCKLIDYGKFKYSLERKKRENAKKQVKGGLKEVKMSYKIDTHDFDVRVRAAQKFIADGDRVKVMVQFKGREMQHRDLGQALLTRYLEQLAGVATVESPTMMEGRTMFMLIAPKTKVAEKKKSPP